jgi:hypothetical protein
MAYTLNSTRKGRLCMISKRKINNLEDRNGLIIHGEQDYDSLDAKFDCSFRNWNPKED